MVDRMNGIVVGFLIGLIVTINESQTTIYSVYLGPFIELVERITVRPFVKYN